LNFLIDGIELMKKLPTISIRWGVVLVIACLVATGCVFMKMKKAYDSSLKSTVIVGRVYGEFKEKGPIIVAACSADPDRMIANYTVLHDFGEYEVLVGHGNYFVFAFQDINSNLIYDPGEPAGQHDNPKLVRAPAVGVVFDIDMVIPRKGSKIVIPPGTEIASIKPEKLYSRQAGDITDFDDERFSDENGAKGFWDYGAFFEELGGNIYFLEEYDPEKIPILFIHGAAGTPRGWQYFVDHLDRTRFQPWFYYYPSGNRIDSMAYLLLWKLINLQSKYQFDTIYITAHSMGGLVARSFIVNYSDHFPYVKLFVSLATPWGGDHMAELGVKQSPVLIPSWIDMQPEGDFIKSLYRKHLPKNLSFYMFCGYKGSRNPFRSNNDGTITLSSIMDYRPQSEAKMNYVFDEDHTSILFSSEVVEQYNAILDQMDEKQSRSRQRSGGYVKINFEYTYEIDGIRPKPLLALIPRGKKIAQNVTYLSNDDSGKIFGPFPAGDYYVAMAAMAAKTQQEFAPVSIENNKTKELDFVFLPDGEIYGCVAASLRPEEKYPGKPDYTYRSADEDIHIQSIQLKGNGIQRTPQPREGKIVEDGALIYRQDYCYNKCFGFFGLPAGDYKLFLQAEGYEPVEKSYSVIPGVPKYFRITELTHE
jgi:pimeloyl-ACP methyl ester carboxylesterase